MRNSVTILFALFVINLFPTAVRADNPARTRVLVVPFQNEGRAQGQDYLQLAFAATLTERLESVPEYDVVSGPLVLTRDVAALEQRRGKRRAPFDLDAANALARSNDAAYFVTGRYSGTEWEWTLIVDVYAVHPDGPEIVARADVDGDLTMLITKKSGRQARIISIQAIHALFAEAVSAAFADSGLPAHDAVKAALIAPSTGDSWAYIQLARAYQRYFAPIDEKSHRSPLELAEYAVRVDPTYPEAQRFYAVLLEERIGQKPGMALKARLHFEAALAKRPNDIRVLIRLGRIETDAGNLDVAKSYLLKAVEARKEDPEPRFWLAETDLKLGRLDDAISGFEKVRDLDPRRLDGRRELAALYCRKARYADAAPEYAAIVAADPADLASVFYLAAVDRKLGKNAEAVAVYAAAESRFPKESRLVRFRKNLEAGDGGVFALVPDIADGNSVAAAMETDRSTFQSSANDTAMDFSLHGKEACRDLGGASSMVLAQNSGRLYFGKGVTLREKARSVRAALDRGDGAALTSDERADADALLASYRRAERDAREMTAQLEQTLVPLLRKADCAIVEDAFTEASLPDVLARDDDRRVELPEVKPPVGAAPDIPPDPAPVIRFRVNNVAGSADYVVVLDGSPMGTVATGSVMVFTAAVGKHDLCLVLKPLDCGHDGTVRSVFLHDGWMLTVKPGRAI